MKKWVNLKWFAAIFFIVFCGILFCGRIRKGTVTVSEGDVCTENGDAAGDTDAHADTAAVGAACAAEDEAERTIFVHVCGEVVSPGVYELPEGSRVIDAVKAAGGLTEDASGDAVNLAAFLADAMRIYIPAVGEQGEIAGGDAGQAALDGRVDINTADAAELETVPGIGRTRAEAIVQYRKEHGAFKSIEDIKNVSGIKDGVFGKIKEYIRAG